QRRVEAINLGERRVTIAEILDQYRGRAQLLGLLDLRASAVDIAGMDAGYDRHIASHADRRADHLCPLLHGDVLSFAERAEDEQAVDSAVQVPPDLPFQRQRIDAAGAAAERGDHRWIDASPGRWAGRRFAGADS